MDIYNVALVAIFKEQNPYKILLSYLNKDLRKKYLCEELERDKIIRIIQNLEPQCSKDECLNAFDIITENLRVSVEKYSNEKNIFNLFLNYTDRMLKIDRENIFCKYKFLLKWRMLTLKINQEILIAAYLAHKDILIGRERRFFGWDVVIKSDNIRLNNILNKGMAENHFHLKGSSPFLNLNWVSLMNDINMQKNYKLKFNKDRLCSDIDEQINMEGAIVVATIIRIILFYSTLNKVNQEEIKNIINDIKKLLNEILDFENNTINYEFIKINTRKIMNEINGLKHEYAKKMNYNGRKVKVDYALGSCISGSNKATEVFQGERCLLYKCFKKIYSNDTEFMEYADLFYVYLIIKNKFRAELIQNNEKVGFSNFSDYQERKSKYIKKNTILDESISGTAVLTSIKNQNILSLEARIIPAMSKCGISNQIKEIDKIVSKYICEDENNQWIKEIDKNIEIDEKYKVERKKYVDKLIKQRLFYVLHFPKKIDSLDQKDSSEIQRCRHYENRKYIKAMSYAIKNLREKNKEEAARILGIDACSNELVMRPEVFGQSFRYLKKHIPSKKNISEETEKMQRLRLTYHVGEDFLDIVDGLRAIDEAIYFLDLTYGDRLGHAIALGIDVKSWYRKKLNKVYLSKQAILDNVAWLISKVKYYNIKLDIDIIEKLMIVYSRYYVEIYANTNENENIGATCC
ncbi:MAG: hypothetical protein ACRCX8_18240 [Sarcina sp.]